MTEPGVGWCERLAWDSTFFGLEIGRLRTKQLSADFLESVRSWCEDNAIDCLYFLADSNDAESIRQAEDFGFNLVDIRVTLTRSVTTAEEVTRTTPIIIRLGGAADLQKLRSVARRSYHDSRFYFDRNFPDEKCDLLYETWLRKCFDDHSGAVLIAEFEGAPIGYITCERFDQETGQIGLLGVDSSAQGMGAGRNLVLAAAAWFREHGFQRAQVVTQGRNIRAQRAYMQCSFLPHSVQLWYHRWFLSNQR